MLFIDSNQYLDLYRKPGLKALLKPLDSVSDRVFITSQIADEVTRNKVAAATDFLTGDFTGLQTEKPTMGGLPNQLFSASVTTELHASLQKIQDHIKATRQTADKAVSDLLLQISQSKDDVSNALARIFDRAVEADQSEFDLARVRKERGRAPGKHGDSLGDQISWEQFLTKAQIENWSRVWIIARDRDYCCRYKETVVLNAALYRDLTQKRPGIVVHCFMELEKGLRHFIETNSIADAQLPTLEEAEAINKEQEALPPFSLKGFDDDGLWQQVVQQVNARRRNYNPAAWTPPNITMTMSDEALPPLARKL